MNGEEKKITLAMRETNHSIKRFVDFYISSNLKWDLTNGEGIVLGHILAFKKKNPGEILTPNKLVRTLSIKKPATSKFLKILECKGFIKTIDNSDDKRLKEIIVTDKGLNVKDDFEKLWRDIDNQVQKGFSEKEKEILIKLLDKIQTNIEGGRN